MNRQLIVLPLLLFGMVAVFAWRGLSIDGQSMPSALLGLPAPEIELEPVPRYPGPFQTSDLRGEVTVVNIWGSWCVYCQYEHPVLLQMQAEGVKIYGIAWNDPPEAAAQWLDRYGSPFEAVGLDQEGYDVADFGVTGAPETFILDKEGRVRYRHQGPVTERQWKRELQPLMIKLAAEEPSEGGAAAR